MINPLFRFHMASGASALAQVIVATVTAPDPSNTVTAVAPANTVVFDE